jgi:two-component system chemotaxis sensor kinase CheA
MTPILAQFLAESRDVLQSISEKLIGLEESPDNAALMTELFRLVHTLKGNSGLFDFPEMTRVLHAAEDLMVVVRDGDLAYSQDLADRLFEAMDFVGMLLDEIEKTGKTGGAHAGASARLAAALRELIATGAAALAGAGAGTTAAGAAGLGVTPAATAAAATSSQGAASSRSLAEVPESLRSEWAQRPEDDEPLLWITYRPESDCFFKGEDPFFQARQTPELLWRGVSARAPWPPFGEFDAYHCLLDFQMVSSAPRAAIEEHFRYVPEQVSITAVLPGMLAAARGAASPAAGAAVTGAVRSPGDAIAAAVISAQLTVLGMPDAAAWLPGRLKGVAATLAGCCRSLGQDALLPSLEAALGAAIVEFSSAPLLAWIEVHLSGSSVCTPAATPADAPAAAPSAAGGEPAAAVPDAEVKPGRRPDDAHTEQKTLKVDQNKIDRMMNLIGEMVVAKNGLPYLAGRAENVFGVRELSREIKTQYAVINRIAEEMQDAIMQVRMMPVSFVFQRFPRLVRDISRKLGKEVHLVLEGEETEADKNIVEALADPLIHIVRNSLDHGIEMPDVRLAAGKPAAGRLSIRASQEADRVVIDISDDGKGIDAAVIKRKAYEKGLIDEATLERISDQEAVNLVFAAGFSTAEVVSDLSGRGVGMDVVRSAVERVNGTVSLESQAGAGTRLRLSLPLSMAVTNVIIIESDGQIFGVPMDMVVETVRVQNTAIHEIKDHQTTVLRGRLVPLRPLNELLAAGHPQRANADGELATLVIRVNGEHVGIVVDDFREVVDIILKPMAGILSAVPGYAGSALLGDGSVLMVLNPKELV